MKFSQINWGPTAFIISYHLALLIGLPIYLMHHSPSMGLMLTSFVLMYVSGLSITVGYHRLYSHLTYRTVKWVEFALLLIACMAAQGSALRWSFDHRIHHAFVDTDKDPYSIKKGFWYAHFLWLLEKPQTIDNKVVSDLSKNTLVRLQHQYFVPLLFITNIIATIAMGYIFNDFFGAVIISWLLRMFFLHHLTWFINSLAHTWGQRTYSEELSAVDNYTIALLTFGEGYHNYHHTFAYDYRNGIRWFHFDPTKWIIWSLSKVGLASKLKKNNSFFIQEKILMERKRIMLEKLQTTFQDKKIALSEKIVAASDSAQAKIRVLRDLSEKYSSVRKKNDMQKVKMDLKNQIHQAKKDLQKDLKACMDLSRHVSTLAASNQS